MYPRSMAATFEDIKMSRWLGTHHGGELKKYQCIAEAATLEQLPTLK